MFFDEDERREITFHQEPSSGSFEYHIEALPITYTGIVENSGGAGEIDVRIIDPETETARDSREIWIDEGERRKLEFRGPYEFEGDEYWIEAEPL
ncbi:hypothetical protein [Halopiger djelfimassiliensis]|uniref:hypothetical protein n=1 Tax=Halopiger djelfimassiliensis TaxID=1293047 RepID=UPI000677CEDD|nr:hypothetical protein [Halopiger djelfimassiliensis]